MYHLNWETEGGCLPELGDENFQVLFIIGCVCLIVYGKLDMSTVLFIDSGLGGLSVWREVSRLNHGLDYLYAFDNEYFPYGEKDDSVIVERCNRIVAAVTSRHVVDLVVVACNTASTVALPSLRANFDIPIVGVVPAIKPAAQLTKTGVIGLLATPATVARKYIDDLITEYAGNCTVIRVGSSELVSIAEEKMKSGTVDKEALADCLSEFKNNPDVDTVVLGCTHFPWLRSEIEKELTSRIRCVDSGHAIARRVNSLLNGIEKGGNSVPKNSLAFMTNSKTVDFSKYQAVFSRAGFVSLEELKITG